MSATPPPADTPPPGEESTDAPSAAAAQAEREDALRILLAMPDAPPAPRLPRFVPAIEPAASSEEASLPVVRSAAAAASHPWTLPHVGLLLLVLTLAGTLAFMTVSRLRGGARATRCAAELRTLAEAFENYRRESGAWPPAVTAGGVMPPELEKKLPADLWSRPTPFGGHYAWVMNSRAEGPALAITAFVPDAPLAMSRDDLRRVDRELDDGDLATGRFRTGFNGWPVYFVGERN